MLVWTMKACSIILFNNSLFAKNFFKVISHTFLHNVLHNFQGKALLRFCMISQINLVMSLLKRCLTFPCFWQEITTLFNSINQTQLHHMVFVILLFGCLKPSIVLRRIVKKTSFISLASLASDTKCLNGITNVLRIKVKRVHSFVSRYKKTNYCHLMQYWHWNTHRTRRNLLV